MEPPVPAGEHGVGHGTGYGENKVAHSAGIQGIVVAHCEGPLEKVKEKIKGQKQLHEGAGHHGVDEGKNNSSSERDNEDGRRKNSPWTLLSFRETKLAVCTSSNITTSPC